MSSHSFLCSSLIPSSSISLSYDHLPIPFAGTRKLWGQDKGGYKVDIHRPCIAISKPRTRAYAGVENVELVNSIKSMLGSMEDGEISCSAYDTAWVGLIEDVNGNIGSPQFPSTLEWIANNQLPDGSWGDSRIFVAHDRLINTLACVVALKKWNLHPDKFQRGLSFFKENISKLENENEEHMPSGFEVVFPSLIEIARSLNIDVPYDSPIFEDIYEKRDLKLTRIPKEMMHNVPTPLLFSLEGMTGLEWEKLLKLQCKDGSFLFSPSSTAFAFMQTKDENCFNYLIKIVQRFNDGVPHAYPNDLFERIWMVDRLQRLGISRYFKPEIKQCLDHIYRHWTKEGICWARNTRVCDIDDTAMGFRLLRLHGYDVSADVFRHFKNDDKFFCLAGQSSEAVSVMFNLYRASQVQFPRDKILEDANRFSSNFLREKRVSHQLLDKWIISKDLPGEVEFALKFPWYASLPRLETRFYIEHYGGEDDAWIGKTLFRLPYVSNNIYLEFAKLDFNDSQALHQMEWNVMKRWYSEMGLHNFGMSKMPLLLTYFMAAASIFEPEKSRERIAWAKTAFLVKTIGFSFENGIIKPNDHELRKSFVQAFSSLVDTPFSDINGNGRRLNFNTTIQKLTDTLLRTLKTLSSDICVAHGRDISSSIRCAWEKWMLKWVEEGDRNQGVAELVVQMINLTSGSWSMEELLSHPQYERLSNLTNTICHQLCNYPKQNVRDNGCFNDTEIEKSRTQKIETAMQELVQVVLQNSSDVIDSEFKQTFLTVARSFYYAAHCDVETIVFHITKVLFEKVN